MYLGHGSGQNSSENSKKTSLTCDIKPPLARPGQLSTISDASHVFQEEVIAKINSSAVTSPSSVAEDEHNERVEQNLQELNFYYGIGKDLTKDITIGAVFSVFALFKQL